MPNPTLTRTFAQVTQDVGLVLEDIIIGTASGGSSTTLQDTQELDRRPAGSLIGAEITVTASDNSTQTRTITGHTKSGGTVTLTVPSWTQPSSGDAYEIHNIGGRGWPRAQKQRAINAAIESVVDHQWTDLESISLASEPTRGGSVTSEGMRRREYPVVPTTLTRVWDVAYLDVAPVEYHRIGYLNTTRAFGDVAGRTRVGQGFQVSSQGLYSYIAVYMGVVGAPTDNLTCVVETNSSGVPSGTAVTDGTSDTVAGTLLQTRLRLVVFSFTPPMLLLENTTYHLTLRRSGAADSSNYYIVGEDNGNNYANGTLSTRDASAWTAVSGSDLLFAISPQGDWISLGRQFWDKAESSTDSLLIKKLPSEGTPFRLRGGADLARLSAENDNCPIRPDWAVSWAVAYLKSARAGTASRDNHAVGSAAWMRQMGLQPLPRRREQPSTARFF